MVSFLVSLSFDLLQLWSSTAGEEKEKSKVCSVVSNELLSDGTWTEEMETNGKEGHKMEVRETIWWGCQNFLKCS